MSKKRTSSRKSSSSTKKRATTASRPARKPARTKAAVRAMRARGVDFNPVKKELRAHIAKLEKQLGGSEARAAAVDKTPYETLDELREINQRLTNICQPTMVIGNS